SDVRRFAAVEKFRVHGCSTYDVRMAIKDDAMSKTIAVIVLSLVPGLSGYAEQGLTLPQAAAISKPQPLELKTTVEWALPKLDDAVRDADLIVRGTLTELKTYLSADERTLYTDYIVTPSALVAARQVAGGPTLTAPTAPAPIVVRVWGGETTIDG